MTAPGGLSAVRPGVLQPLCGLAVIWRLGFGFSTALHLPWWSFITVSIAATLTAGFLWVITKLSHGGAWSRHGQR